VKKIFLKLVRISQSNYSLFITERAFRAILGPLTDYSESVFSFLDFRSLLIRTLSLFDQVSKYFLYRLEQSHQVDQDLFDFLSQIVKTAKSCLIVCEHLSKNQ
jgi:hypothetical protein